MKTDNKTGVRIPYKDTDIELVEWKCPYCCHRWFEYSDDEDYPNVCPVCGSDLSE